MLLAAQELLAVVGLLFSATMALSSTTFLGNAMAGVMIRAVRNFRIGDFIRCDQHFGRVTERGLFHTEIQTEDRELTTLPNLYLVTHPVTTVRASGTVISATVAGAAGRTGGTEGLPGGRDRAAEARVGRRGLTRPAANRTGQKHSFPARAAPDESTPIEPTPPGQSFSTRIR